MRSFPPLRGKLSKSIAILSSHLKCMKCSSKEEDRGPVLFPETCSPAEQRSFWVLQQSNHFQATSASSINGQGGDRGVTLLCTASGAGLTPRDKLLLKAAALWRRAGVGGRKSLFSHIVLYRTGSSNLHAHVRFSDQTIGRHRPSVSRALGTSRSQRCAPCCAGLPSSAVWVEDITLQDQFRRVQPVPLTQSPEVPGVPGGATKNLLTYICWSLIKTAFLMRGVVRNSNANTIWKNTTHDHFYRNSRKLFLCICAPSTGSSAFTEASQRKFYHWSQREQKRGMRARFLIGITLMDSQKPLS